jgi:hypothetical protein
MQFWVEMLWKPRAASSASSTEERKLIDKGAVVSTGCPFVLLVALIVFHTTQYNEGTDTPVKKRIS